MIRSEIHYYMSGMEYISVEQEGRTVEYMIDRWKSDCIDRINYGAKNGIIRNYSITKKSGKNIKGGACIELTFYVNYKYGYDMITLEIYIG